MHVYGAACIWFWRKDMTRRTHNTFRFVVKSLLLVAVVLTGRAGTVAAAVSFDEAEVAARMRNYKAVYEILLPLAEQGDSQAQYQIAALFRAGRGVVKNLAEAVLWMRKAAEGGYDKGQYNLGLMLEKGVGTAVDPAKARYWYTEASAQGFTPAAEKLADLATWQENMTEIDTEPENRPQPLTWQSSEQGLRWSASKGKVDEVLRLLSLDVQVDAQDDNGRTALMEGALHGYPVIIEVLLAHGADAFIQDRYLDNALLLATGAGHVDCVKLLLAKGRPEVNVPDIYGNTPLIVATGRGNADMVDALLQAEADVYAVNKKKQSAIELAVARGYDDIVTALLAAGAVFQKEEEKWITTSVSLDALLSDTRESVEHANHGDSLYVAWPPLIVAVWRGQAEVVEQLLARDVAVDLIDTEGHTALSRAVWQGYPWIVAALLEAGANPHRKLPDGTTLLMGASAYGHGEIVGQLLAAGLAVNAQQQGGNTALSYAVRKGQTEITAMLLAAGANPNLGDNGGITPLMRAALGHASEAELLLHHGANVNGRDRDGRSPLWYAANDGFLDVVTIMTGMASEINAIDNQGQTALARAAFNGHDDVVRFLLGRGVDVDATTSLGNTPLILAAGQGHGAIVNSLIQHGAEVDARNENGNTPLMLAVARGHAEIVKDLLDAGANRNLRNNKQEKARMLAQGNNNVLDLLQNYRSKKSLWFGWL